MMEKKKLISCRNLNFSFDDNKVLKNISLDFYPGEFVALLGRNGAGKSTLLSCLCGLRSSRSDQLVVDGLDLSKAGARDIARRLSYVPQEHEEIFPFSVLDVVIMGRTAFLGSFGAPGKKDVELAREVLGELQISDLAHRTYTTLSGGEKQLVLLARALVQTRKIVFLDEPTNHLDYKNRYLMLSRLKRLSRDDKSCVVACLHDPNHALLFADRVILLHDGEILDDGITKDVLSGSAVSRLYGVVAWQNKNSEPQNIFPAFVHPGFKGRVLLLSGRSGEGKTTMLRQIVAENKDKRVGGIVCPGSFKNGLRHSSNVHCLGTGASAPFAERADTQRGGFTFSGEGQALADKALESSINEKKDYVIVDEVGPMELRGQGHASLLAPLLSLETPKHIWAIRPDIIDAVCQRWMLIDPVIVNVCQPDALARIQKFIDQKGGIHD